MEEEPVDWDPTLSSLLSSLQEAKEDLPASEEDFNFLKEMLQSKDLYSLFRVFDLIVTNMKDDKFCPVLSNSMQIALEVLDLIADKTQLSDDIKEVFYILQKPHLQGLLCAHDAVAQKDYYPRLPDLPLEVDEDEETIKIVQLVKSNEPLGATIKTDEESGKIMVARIMHGGAADRSGLIHVGDEVVEVNGINVEGKTPTDVLQILQNSEGTITLKLVPADSQHYKRESKIRVRAHFSYAAHTDPYIPCKEAGLDFNAGDILHIVSQDDAYWWQARREVDKNTRAGLIPSKALQERRIIHQRSQKQEEQRDCEALASFPLPSCQSPKSPPCTLTTRSKIKIIMYDTAENDDYDREEIPTYEEVAKYYPRPGTHRPIVLIGPPGVGRNELKRRLIATDPDKFRSPVPYTSRPPRPGEVDGREYVFISREEMERLMLRGNLIEFGEYKGNLYGTSFDSVMSLMDAGYVCILNPHYQALKMLRSPKMKPYVIFIKPPSFEELKDTRLAARARSTFDESSARGFTDDELRDMLKNGRRIEFLYGHWFDETIINSDLSNAFEQLLRIQRKAETEPLWVPVSWVH